MSVILKGAVKLYYYLNEDIADPRTENWFLIRSPWPGLGILALYLYTIFRWIPNHMKDREPYDLRKILVVFNIVQILSCGYIFYKSLSLGWLNHYSYVCQPIHSGHPNDDAYAFHVCFVYFIIKILDLLDTVFFALRKKQNQITFLHVYHHTGMTAVAWGMVKWVPGGHMTLLVVLNTFVHMVMYFYYLLTVIDDSYKKSIWWKKHVTQLQIVQFAWLLVHFCLLAVAQDCNHPKQPTYVMIPQNLFMFVLFTDFYIRTYYRKKKE